MISEPKSFFVGEFLNNFRTSIYTPPAGGHLLIWNSEEQRPKPIGKSNSKFDVQQTI